MNRTVDRVIPARRASDGDGVKLWRSIGATQAIRHDPFLLLDEISSDQAADYIGGFPAHPHRGFETITYMLEGYMQHKDHMGNVGLLKPGGAQWMTAAHGIIHEEIPQQEQGAMHGFQLWLNLPSAEKMKPAWYRDIEPTEVGESAFLGGLLRLVSGQINVAGVDVAGPINTPDSPITTDPIIAEIRLDSGGGLQLPLASQYNAFIYLFEGDLMIQGNSYTPQSALILSEGDELELSSTGGARALLLAGLPIGEPVVQRGPFVMNTQEELYQAMEDYGNGTLTQEQN
jgi:redox-sensitive bicupin YhaK (pirin superfamily)